MYFFLFSAGVDVWIPFLNEQGEEYDMNNFEGIEFADNWSSAKGGNGGGAWTEDCGCKGLSCLFGVFVPILLRFTQKHKTSQKCPKIL